MGHVEFFFRASTILFIISVILLFLVDAGTLEFKVTALSAVISFIISIVSIWFIIKENK